MVVQEPTNCEDIPLLLENIEEYVMDQNKIVTYLSLSKDFQLHVNTAKRILQMFTEKYKDTDHLLVNFLASGFAPGPGGSKILRYAVVPAKYLAHFPNLRPIHVYSVQKSSSNPDSSLLYAADLPSRDDSELLMKLSSINPLENNVYTQIKNPEAEPNEPTVAPFVSVKKEVKPAPVDKKKMFFQPKPKSANTATPVATPTPTPTPAAAPTPAPVVTPTPTPTPKENKKAESPEKSKKAAKGAKATQSKKTKEELKKAEEIDLPSSPEAEKKPPKKQTQKKKGKEQKQWRRVKRVVSSSESEEESSIVKEEEEEHGESPQTSKSLESPENTPSTQMSAGEAGRMHRKVWRKKTFLDEDGFMVTEKVQVSDSGSEHEEEGASSKTPPPSAKETSKTSAKEKPKASAKASKGKKNSSPVKSPPKAKKQVSLTNFFTRK